MMVGAIFSENLGNVSLTAYVSRSTFKSVRSVFQIFRNELYQKETESLKDLV